MLKDLGTKTLETERLILRKFKIDDAGDMYNNWASNYETAKFMTWDKHEDINETREILTNWVKQYDEQHTYHWVIGLKDTKEIIGSIGVVKLSIIDETSEVGYCMGPKYWGNGYMTETLKEVLRYLLKEVDFRLVETRHITGNPASGRVMEKAGMKKDAILRNRSINKHTKEVNDFVLYSMMREEI